MNSILSIPLLASALFCYSLTGHAIPQKIEIQKQFQKVEPTVSVDSIAMTPIKGLYEVKAGAKVFYSNEDGKYMLYGHMLDLTSNKPISITEEAMKGARLNALKHIDANSELVFKAKNQPKKHTLTVFTDIDCGYCRKLHLEVPKLNEAGIEVRYISFPRSGVNTPSFYKAANVWCSDNPQQAMTNAKAGQDVPKTEGCDKTAVIKEHLKLVRELELNGTPALLLEDGTMIPGYLPAEQLISRVNSIENNTAA